ncbi:efflux RND transporter periplasmic adaptor subunit [Dongshaea marina]|uniref:efflux RND transporter periplasmic adaptor subunit n=1 Tax=Dongshaea marina TaxID=2047966 RepID=UPI000D3E2CFE|nr:HlyD family efflux transporter periplasmic adaptor subunit [Dongshaea marina]
MLETRWLSNVCQMLGQVQQAVLFLSLEDGMEPVACYPDSLNPARVNELLPLAQMAVQREAPMVQMGDGEQGAQLALGVNTPGTSYVVVVDMLPGQSEVQRALHILQWGGEWLVLLKETASSERGLSDCSQETSGSPPPEPPSNESMATRSLKMKWQALSSRSRLCLFTASVLVILCTVLMIPAEYRIHSQATIEGEIERAIVSPFDGYLLAIHARAGQSLKAGDPVATLDGRELRLRQQQLMFKQDQLRKQYRQALAEQHYAESRLYLSQLDELKADLKLLQNKLEMLELKAPIDGVIISGDLRRAVGAPLEKGQLLFEMAPLARYRVELQVDERDIDRMTAGDQGMVTLNAFPGEEFPLIIEKRSMVFTDGELGTSYLCEARIEARGEALRPGMRGIAKIKVGKATLGWQLTHDLIDWLRLKFWAWSP